MKLAFVNSSYQFGGSETVARELSDGCRAVGHQTRLYVGSSKTYPRAGDVFPLYPAMLSRLYHSRARAWSERIAPPARWTERRFRGLATGWPDVVHVHSFHGQYAPLESLAYLARRKPVVWTFHGHWGVTGGCDHPRDCTRFEVACGECPRLGVWPLGEDDDTSAQLELKVRHLADLPLTVISPAKFLADRIRRSRVGRDWTVHWIPNGVSLAAFSGRRKGDEGLRNALGLERGTTTILMVNRTFRDLEKGFDIARDALNGIARPDSVQVVLAGRDSDWAAATLRPQLRPLSLGYIASKTRMAELFEAADVLLFASPAETFPCVTLEAMAAECCVVATPTTGVVEQLQDGSSGLLADEVSATALARVLNLALGDPHLRRRLGANARETVQASLSAELMVRRHIDVYEHARTATAAAARSKRTWA